MSEEETIMPWALVGLTAHGTVLWLAAAAASCAVSISRGEPSSLAAGCAS